MNKVEPADDFTDRFRAMFNINSGAIPADYILEILKTFNIKVIFIDNKEDGDRILCNGGKFKIVVDKKKYSEEGNYYLCYLFGRIIFSLGFLRKGSYEEKYSDKLKKYFIYSTEQIWRNSKDERQAECFALNFTVPDEIFIKKMESGETEQQLMDFFKINLKQLHKKKSKIILGVV